jgi:hypothetical protein
MQQNRFEVLARAGYGARGFVYLLLGAVAITSALWSGDAEGTSGALSGLLGVPFGRILIGLVAVGLLGYVLWKLAQGLLDADHVGDDAKGFFTRAGHLVSAGANVFLLLTAANLALGRGSGGEGNGEESASAWLLQQPFGPYLLGMAGAAVIAAGIIQVWYGASGAFRKRLSLPAQHESWMDRICRFGLIARGVVLAIIGGFLGYAAFTVSPDNAAGTAEALDYVHSLPFGPWLYGIIALGFLAFGAYGVVQAMYRSIDAPSLAQAARQTRRVLPQP